MKMDHSNLQHPTYTHACTVSLKNSIDNYVAELFVNVYYIQSTKKSCSLPRIQCVMAGEEKGSDIEPG